jgi:hypothetical protein
MLRWPAAFLPQVVTASRLNHPSHLLAPPAAAALPPTPSHRHTLRPARRTRPSPGGSAPARPDSAASARTPTTRRGGAASASAKPSRARHGGHARPDQRHAERLGETAIETAPRSRRSPAAQWPRPATSPSIARSVNCGVAQDPTQALRPGVSRTLASASGSWQLRRQRKWGPPRGRAHLTAPHTATRRSGDQRRPA